MMLVITLSASSCYLLMEDTSCATDIKKVDVKNAVRARDFAKNLLDSLLHHEDTILISASEMEMNSIMAFMSRGINRLSGCVKVTTDGINIAFSLRLPHNLIGDYLNLRARIGPSEDGFHITQASLGRVSIPGWMVFYMTRFLLNWILGDRGGTVALASVKSVTIEEKSVFIQIRPIPYLKERVARIKERFKSIRDRVALLGDPGTVRIYYAKLLEIDKSFPTKEPVSLAQFIRPLFQLALERAGDPADENQAAVLALGMFLGSEHFGSFIGPVKTKKMKKQPRRIRRVVLGNREDLRLHFLISAGLKIISDRGITHAVGEFKELMDAERGGSKFSFVDLAADRTGVRFAEVATDRSGGAKRIQWTLSRETREETFFPNVQELPEGLSQAEIEHFFGNVESDIYLALVRAIDQCIARLPAYHSDVAGQQKAETGDCRISEVVPEPLKQRLAAKGKNPEQTPPRKRE